ncbi:MAG: isochorismate synthase [Anaerolineae bacterium]|nr:isochorismate synthase [Anaerolineae bacterium]
MNLPKNSTYTSIPAQYGRLISVHIPCDVSLAAFLQSAQGQPRFYWESSRDDVAFAGIGTALELKAWGADRFETIRHHAMELFADAMVLNEEEPLAAPRLFGGFSFRDDFVPDVAWSDFTPAHFVLPHYQLVRVGATLWLSINANIPYGENPIGLLPELKAALQKKADELRNYQMKSLSQQAHTDLTYPMPYGVWERIITDATKRMTIGELNKVVLSRVAEVRFAERVHVDSALDYLAQTYPETYRFLFEPRPYHAFYGATPELLASVNGKQVETMALAGSIRRGNSLAEDDIYGNELLNSPKDSYEHQLVIDGVKSRLEALTENLNIGTTGIMRLSNIQHIHTPISGTLRQDNGVIPVVEALHPTPALGGNPRELAMKLIGDYEPAPRGWYGAPVGWLDRHMNGQFGVAIRSAVAQDKRVWLYAGAGIVADSEPQKEWDETALKFIPMLRALGIENDET